MAMKIKVGPGNSAVRAIVANAPIKTRTEIDVKFIS